MVEEVSLYFHIPFCSKKCPYCHFFVVKDRENLHRPFLDALLQELELRRADLEGKRIISVYFGGGTPTKLPAAAYLEILSKLALAPDCEVTLEANPEDVSLEAMQAYKEAGINRVSMGVQSLVSKELQLLGRTHTTHRAIDATLAIYRAGVENLSIDLMFELPGQTLASWKKSLENLQELPITHLSLYNLTIEPHTAFFRQRQWVESQIAPDSERVEMLHHAVEALEGVGLKRYEISAFAKEGFHSRHNGGYWTGRPFLGFGPSAFSYWQGERMRNIGNLISYQEQVGRGELPIDFREKLEYPHNLHELLAIRLRLVEGVDLDEFAELPQETKAKIQPLMDRGWIKRWGSCIALTKEGQLFYDSVATELV